MIRPSPSSRVNKQLIFTIIWTCLWVGIVFKILFSSLPYNPLSPDYGQKVTLITIIPQGWGFFTRDPREPDLVLYTLRDKQWEKSPFMPISAVNNLMGLNRFPRAQSVELAMILSRVKGTDWRTTNAKITDVVVNTQEILSIPSLSPLPTLNDTLCIVLKEPVPWAWTSNRGDIAMPSKYVIVNVTSLE